MFQMRTSKPSAGNKYYITKSKGGYSNAIVGSPTDGECNVLSNCVGYAYGRFNEIGGYDYCKYLAPVNAENFIQYKGSCDVNQTPRVGDCMVWQKGASLSGSDGAGHVAIVERVDSPTQVYTSESGYGSNAFWNSTRKKGNGNWGAGVGYTFLGFIKNPAIKDEPIPTPQPTKSIDEVAREVINGNWGNGDERKTRLTNAGYDYNVVQTRVNEILAGSQPQPTPQPQVNLLELVKKTIRGDFGNGQARKNALGSNYTEVQRQVNLNLQNGNTNWDNIKLY